MYLITHNKKECSGCSACEMACPKNCIHMEKDQEGFLYPKIDQENCINCGLCEKSCPFNLKPKKQKSTFLSGYARNEDVHKKGSSGSFFYNLAKRILQEDGYVFGVIIDNNLIVKHISIHDEKLLDKMCKSKYVQSNIGNSFKSVKKLLDSGKKVMFVGTPCQVNGLKMYLKKEYDQLLLVDFACHGVASQDMFTKLIKNEEETKRISISDFIFRNQSQWNNHPHNFKYTYTKNNHAKEKKGSYFSFPYYYAYKTYNFFRPSCYDCKYNSKYRVSDITLSDFWKGQKYYKNIKIKNGVSLIAINSKKGEEYINAIKEQYHIKTHENIKDSEISGWKEKIFKDDTKRNFLFKEFARMDIDAFRKKYLKPSLVEKFKILFPYCVPLFVINLKNKLLKNVR